MLMAISKLFKNIKAKSTMASLYIPVYGLGKYKGAADFPG